jgi:cytochrome c-type biogenesis protein CcmE
MDHTLDRPSVKRRVKFLVGAAAVVVALGSLVGWAMGRPGSTDFYVSVGAVRALGSTPPGRDYRVNGRVVPGSIERDGVRTTFVIADGGHRLPVTTDEPLPDAFKNNSDVVARGTYDGHRFTATQVLAKCPSKFKAA